MLTTALTRGEFISDLSFNLDPAVSLPFGIIPLTGVPPTAVGLGVDAFQADGDGRYDVQLQFATAGIGMFTGAQTAAYLLTGAGSARTLSTFSELLTVRSVRSCQSLACHGFLGLPAISVRSPLSPTAAPRSLC
jgi:hypothetical protein